MEETSDPYTNTTTSQVIHLDEDIERMLYGLIAPPIIGLPGNLLAIAVACRRQNSNLSPSVYIIAMGVADSVFLLAVVCFVVILKCLDKGIFSAHETLLLTRYVGLIS